MKLRPSTSTSLPPKARAFLRQQAERDAARAWLGQQARRAVARAELNVAAKNARARSGAADLRELSADLPEGWTAHLEKKTGRTFFYHKAFKKSTWKRPVIE